MALKTNSTVQSMKKKIDSKKSKMNTKKGTIVKRNDRKESANKNKHIVFDDDDDDNDGKVIIKAAASEKPNKAEKSRKDAIEIGKQWYSRFDEYNTGEEPIDMKTSEIEELTNLCRKCYESEMPSFEKCNPSDVKWLKTALHKGTSRDRANAGALLVQTNPLANLETLETLISFAKVTNKQSNDSVDVTTDLFINALLPPNRKLISFALRGADWKSLKKNDSVNKSTKDQIYAYWHIETAIKDQYSEFLRNIQGAIQGTQDSKKGQAIICAAKLLSYAPEKEQMLLSMVVNKLGDPSRAIASKALHQLIDVSHKHPAMCGVMTNETEKILFRNNITDHAQHFALCFLSQVAPHSNVDVCTKLVNICMSFFKIAVNKGQVNSKIMQAILLCLKHSITDVICENAKQPGTDSGLLSKDMQDTIYRLVHFADIKVSLQTLALLLQIVTALDDSQLQNRFYNALYKKIFDPDLVACSHKFSALFLHIIHRAVYFDRNKSRAQAFIKRLLQAALNFPAHITCGCLIIINKLVKTRSELNRIEIPPIKMETADSIESDVTKNLKSAYDPINRTPEFAGAQYAIRTELIALTQHYHPSVRVFAQDLIKNATIKFYGDPLIDFSLSYFLDRFAFKNPKKDAKQETVAQSFYHKHYVPRGSRGNSVNQLNNTNCTEDERYIFEYLNRKRERRAALGLDKPEANNDEIDDDEFDAYLDSMAGGKSKANEIEDDDDELDFMGDFGSETKKFGKDKNKSRIDDQEDDDWDSEPESDNEDNDEFERGDGDDDLDAACDRSSDGSVSLHEDGSDLFESEDENFGNDSDSEAEVSDPEDDDGPKSKRFKPVSGKEFQKKLKNTNNMSSLFAAVEDFSEMLDDTSKSNKHGTLGEVFNKDKSSEKQIEWESKRLKNAGGGFGRKSKPKPKRNRSQGKKNRGESMNQSNKKKPMADGKRKK